MYFISEKRDNLYGVLNDKTGVTEYYNEESILKLNDLVRIKGVHNGKVDVYPINKAVFEYSRLLDAKYIVANKDYNTFDVISKYIDYCNKVGYKNIFSYNYISIKGEIFIWIDNSSIQGMSKLDDIVIPYFSQGFSGLFNYKTNITSIVIRYFDSSREVNLAGLFNGCSKLNKVDMSNVIINPDILYMSHMFQYCSRLEFLDLSCFDNIDLKSVSTSGMFDNCIALYELERGNIRHYISLVEEMNRKECTESQRIQIKNELSHSQNHLRTSNLYILQSFLKFCIDKSEGL